MTPADERFYLSELPTQKLPALPAQPGLLAAPIEAPSTIIFAAERFTRQTYGPDHHYTGGVDSFSNAHGNDLALPVLPSLPSGSSSTLRRWQMNNEDDLVRTSRYDQSITNIAQQLREQESPISEQGPPARG